MIFKYRALVLSWLSTGYSQCATGEAFCRASAEKNVKLQFVP